MATEKEKFSIKVKKSGDNYLEQAVSKSDEKIKYDVKIDKDKQEINFDEKKDGALSTNELEIKFTEHGKNDWKEGKAKVKCNKSIWRETYEIVPEISQSGTKIELKEVNKKLGTDIHSYGWGFYAAIVVVIMIIVGFIWWWISSSKKEDKEEESL